MRLPSCPLHVRVRKHSSFKRIVNENSLKLLHKVATYQNTDKVSFQFPCIIEGLSDKWSAVKNKRWSVENLAKLYGDQYFQCGSYGADEPIFKTLSEYLKQINTSSELNGSVNPLYIFDPQFDIDNVEMLEDYMIPEMFQSFCQLTASLKPNYRWFLLGPPNSGSDLHIDPLHTSAWNTLTSGMKLWFAIEPLKYTKYTEGFDAEKSSFYFDVVDKMDTYAWYEQTELPNNVNSDNSCEQFEDVATESAILMASSGDHCSTNQTTSLTTHPQSIAHWFEHTVPQLISQLNATQPTRRVFLFVQRPGDTVFIPAQWHHAVLNLETSVAVTHNFILPEHIEKYLEFYKAAFTLSDSDMLSVRSEINSKYERHFGAGRAKR